MALKINLKNEETGFASSFIKISISLLVLVSLQGCIAFSNIDSKTKFDGFSTDSIIVMGVRPRYRVAIGPGEIRPDGKVKIGQIAALNVYPENGYIVGKVASAEETNEYHVQLILPEGIGGFVPAYAPCGDQQVASFFAPRGKIVYVGDMDFTSSGAKMAISYSQNFSNAQSFMAKYYPGLASKLEHQPLQGRSIVHVDCAPRSVTIPVYIPSRR